MRLLLECSAVLGGLRNELRTHDNLATGLLESLALAGNGIAGVFWLYAAARELVIVSCNWYVRCYRGCLSVCAMCTFLDMNDADLAIVDDEAADSSALLVIDTLGRGT